jgi:phage repressor protein C with HTH and peptisase S24 domain
MGWANEYIEALKAGQTIKFRPHGNSMTGKIESGQLCTVEPITKEIEKGDIVLCKVNGKQFLHLVTATQGDRCQISNNKNHINGWTSKNQIYGKCVKVED